jgi:hypothetical protein
MIRSFLLPLIGITLMLTVSCKAPTDFDMKEELARLYAAEQYPDAIIRADLGVARLESMPDTENQTELQVRLAGAYLLNGGASQAIRIFEKLLAGFQYDPQQSWLTEPFLQGLLALSYFRLGEIENCQNNHNEFSCILPFQPEARHIMPLGAQKAIEIYGDLLSLNPANHIARWMLNVAYMAIGKHPEGVPNSWLIDFDQFKSEETFPVFKDVAASAGVDYDGLYGGVIAEDFNGDGLIDLFVTSGLLRDNVALLLRNPYGGFYDATEHFQLAGITGGVHAIQADYNNDGHMDIFILRGGWQLEGGKHPNSLLRNNGDGSFSDVTFNAGLLDYSPSHSAVWADFDGDGFLDLFVGHETGSYDLVDFPEEHFEVPQHPSKLFRNNGDETFTDVSEKAGIRLSKWVKGVVFIDYNNDNKSDLYVSCYNGTNHLFRNDSKGHGQLAFTDITDRAGVGAPFFSFPVVAADFNNDGLDDLFVPGYFTDENDLAEEYVLQKGPRFPAITYLNNADGTFRIMEADKGPQQSILAMGLNAGDLDNDGRLDIYAGTGAGSLSSLYPNVMLKNTAGGGWADVTTVSRTGHLQKAHSIAFCDFDDDGDLDIYFNLGGIFTGDNFWNALYENPGNQHDWLKLKLEGTTSNRCAIGAKVAVTVRTEQGLKTFYRVVQPGGSYAGSPLLLHFGLGIAAEVEKVDITWPSGLQQTAKTIKANSTYHWKEGEGKPSLLPSLKISIAGSASSHDMHSH